MIPIPFCGPTYKNDSLSISAQTCINLYPEINGKDSKVVAALKPTPGSKLWVTLTGGGAIRKIRTCSNNRFFGLCGNTLTEVTTDGTKTIRGTINSYEGRIDMSDNGLELIIVDGEEREGWIFTFATNTLTQITSSGYPGGTHVSFINQRFLVNKPNTQQFYWSGLADGLTWDGSFSSAEGSPDNINSKIAFGGEEWVFGSQSYEVFDNIGTAFVRIDGTHNDIGCVAPDSISKTDSNIFWLGGDDNGHGKVMTNVGYRAQPISDPAIEQAIQRYSKIDDAIGYCYQQLGHEFYVLGFPSAGTTWVYDLSTNFWHERNYTDSNGIHYMHRGVTQDFFNGEVYVGDWLSGNIYELDPDTMTDNGDEIHRERAGPHIWNNMGRVFYGSFQLDIEVGVGRTGDGQDSNPQVMLQVSNDGGKTWGNEKWKSAGKIGEYKKRLIWNRMGTSRDRVFRIRMTDSVKWVILGAYVDLK